MQKICFQQNSRKSSPGHFNRSISSESRSSSPKLRRSPTPEKALKLDKSASFDESEIYDPLSVIASYNLKSTNANQRASFYGIKSGTPRPIDYFLHFRFKKLRKSRFGNKQILMNPFKKNAERKIYN